MLAIEFSRQSEKFLKKILPKHRRQIAEKIFALAHEPYASDTSKLHGYEYYRADIGEYRIIYNTSSSTLYILLIGKRNDGDIYRRLGRR